MLATLVLANPELVWQLLLRAGLLQRFCDFFVDGDKPAARVLCVCNRRLIDEGV